MRLYISGPINGIEDYISRFSRAADALQSIGYETVDPCDVGPYPHEEWGVGCSGDVVVPHSEHTWECHMRADIVAMMQCEGVALLPGWEGSSGATVEKHLAEGLHMEVRELAAWIIQDESVSAIEREEG